MGKPTASVEDDAASGGGLCEGDDVLVAWLDIGCCEGALKGSVRCRDREAGCDDEGGTRDGSEDVTRY